LNNPDLFKDKNLVGGKWVEAKSGKRFDVYGESTNLYFNRAKGRLIDQSTQTQEMARSGQPHRTATLRIQTPPSKLHTKPSCHFAKSTPRFEPSVC